MSQNVTVPKQSNYVRVSQDLPSGAQQIMSELTSQATSILGATLKTSLSEFQVGALGNFPYYWQDPSSLAFNSKTYNWISTNLMADTQPAELDSANNFNNEYIRALSSIIYSLSTTDQETLNTARQNAMDFQMALLNAWQSAGNSIPPASGGLQPIDIIVKNIASNWASPATTFRAMQQSRNLFALLNNMPPSGGTIIPVLANWLNALGSAIGLIDATTTNTSYLSSALNNVQSPVAGLQAPGNGGLPLNDTTVQPSYAVSTQLADILNGLKNTGSAAKLVMTVTTASDSEYSVSINGQASFNIPIDDFLTLSIAGNVNYSFNQMVSQSNSVTVEMDFTGITLVNFGPVAFQETTGLYAFWMEPITEAKANGSSDVSGFKFSPDPQIDFSANGPFGYLTGAVISNYPAITITVQSSSFASIEKTFSQSVSFGLDASFLGIDVSLASGSESSYSHSASSDSSTQTVVITLTAPPNIIPGNPTDSTAWILGVQTQYPVASVA